MPYDHVLGERAVVGEAWLRLAFAYLLVASRAWAAGPAPAHERRGDSLAAAPQPHRLPDRVDGARELVPRYVWHRDVRITAVPAVPIASADTSGLDADDRTIVGSGGFFEFDDLEWTSVGPELDGSHPAQPTDTEGSPKTDRRLRSTPQILAGFARPRGIDVAIPRICRR